MTFHHDLLSDKLNFLIFHFNDWLGCGGIVTGALGIIQSPNYPQNYPNNQDCVCHVN